MKHRVAVPVVIPLRVNEYSPPPHPLQPLFLVVLLILAVLTGLRWKHQSFNEFFSRYFLAILISSFENSLSLFRFQAHFGMCLLYCSVLFYSGFFVIVSIFEILILCQKYCWQRFCPILWFSSLLDWLFLFLCRKFQFFEVSPEAND